jgi:hypothetical protein
MPGALWERPGIATAFKSHAKDKYQKAAVLQRKDKLTDAEPFFGSTRKHCPS